MKFLEPVPKSTSALARRGRLPCLRREKYIEYGGPEMVGDGGRWLCLGRGLRRAEHADRLSLPQHFLCKNGQPGMGKQRTGKDGDDIILRVPVGTETCDEDQETVLVA